MENYKILKCVECIDEVNVLKWTVLFTLIGLIGAGVLLLRLG